MLSALLGLALVATPSEPPGIVVEASTIDFKATSTPEWKNRLSEYPELEKLAKCESGLNEKAVNKMDTDGYPAYGLFQYKTFTWEAFQKEMGTSSLDIMSGDDQLEVTLWAMAHNKQSHWGICL